MIEYRTHLLICDTGEPLYELGGLRSIFQVLEQRRNRNASASEYPLATDALWVSFYDRAR